MSNRTIVEINHDMAGFIDRNPEGFVALLSCALRSGDKEDWKLLERFGIRFGLMSHHSNDRFCGTIYGEGGPRAMVNFP